MGYRFIDLYLFYNIFFIKSQILNKMSCIFLDNWYTVIYKMLLFIEIYLE